MKSKLDLIEERLQYLIEGGVARLFPAGSKQNSLAYRLVEAMKASLRSGQDGEPVAPNLFSIVVHPSQVHNLEANPNLLDSLAQSLREAGIEAGLRFSGPPVVRVAANRQFEPGEVQVIAQHSQENLRQTSTFVVERLEEAGTPPPNAFLIVDGTHIVSINQPVINLGRNPENQVVIDDPRVSRVHAQLRAVKGRYVIFDLASSGGTFVNGERIQRSALQPGDVISLSGVPVVFGMESSQTGNGRLPETQDYSP